MAKILVSLVSDQTIPNVLFIKERGDVDRYLFVSTEKMESKGKSGHIIRASGSKVADNSKVLLVREDSLQDIEKKLNDECTDSTDKYIINLTAGTKIMAIGVYNFFSNLNSEIVYIPIRKNHYRVLHSVNEMTDENIKYRIGVAEYLTGYGIEIKNPKKIGQTTFTEEQTELFFEFYLKLNDQSLRQINSLREYRKKNIAFNKLSDELVNLLKTCPVLDCNDRSQLRKNEIKCLTGDWFEEYIYFQLKSRLKLDDSAIAIGVQIKREQVDNEIDIMFTYENRLFVIECKTSIYDLNQERNILNDSLYKISALKKDFGLFVKPYLFTLSPAAEIKTNHLNRSDLFGIEVVDRETLCDPGQISKLIAEI